MSSLFILYGWCNCRMNESDRSCQENMPEGLFAKAWMQDNTVSEKNWSIILATCLAAKLNQKIICWDHLDRWNETFSKLVISVWNYTWKVKDCQSWKIFLVCLVQKAHLVYFSLLWWIPWIDIASCLPCSFAPVSCCNVTDTLHVFLIHNMPESWITTTKYLVNTHPYK